MAAEKALKAITEADEWETNAQMLLLEGAAPPSKENLSKEGKITVEERVSDLQNFSNRLLEIEMQVRNAKKVAEKTRDEIKNAAQYVNFSSINLKANGHLSSKVEEEINAGILKVPKCGRCEHCTNDQSYKLCVDRQKVRDALLEEAEKKYAHTASKGTSNADTNKSKPGPKAKRAIDSISGPSTKQPRKSLPGMGKAHGSGGSRLGSKPMAVPKELISVLVHRISINGTDRRIKLIDEFVKDYPDTSNRQVTFKVTELTTKDKPACAPDPKRRDGPGRAVHYYLRPRFYHMLPEADRPEGWEKYAKEDELAWQEEVRKEEEEKAKKKKEKADARAAAKAVSAESASDSPTSEPPAKKQKS